MDTSPGQVRSHLSAAPIPETPVFSLTATSDSSEGAIRLSTLASQALVTEVDRASQADPTRLLDEYRTAELERQQVSNRVDALTATRWRGPGGGSSPSSWRRRHAPHPCGTPTRPARTSGAVPLEIIQKADRASSDRSSVLQLRVFVAIVVGLVLGMALAALP